MMHDTHADALLVITLLAIIAAVLLSGCVSGPVTVHVNARVNVDSNLVSALSVALGGTNSAPPQAEGVITDEWDDVLNPVCPPSPPEAPNRESAKWKYDRDGHGGNNKPRLVIRLPTTVTRDNDLTDAASCWVDLTSAVPGVTYTKRVPWYKTDNEQGNKRASFQVLWSPSEAPAKIKVRVRTARNGVTNVVAGWVETKPAVAAHNLILPKRMGDEAK